MSKLLVNNGWIIVDDYCKNSQICIPYKFIDFKKRFLDFFEIV